MSEKTTRPLTLDNHVARIVSEARPAWWNAETAKGRAGLDHRTSRDKAFEAGVRAALSDLPQAAEARAALARAEAERERSAERSREFMRREAGYHVD